MLPQGGVVAFFYNHPLLSGELFPLWGLGGSRAPPVRGGSPQGDYGGLLGVSPLAFGSPPKTCPKNKRRE